jgi:hypothetical protein
VVKLYNQTPAIQKLDNSLNNLKMCEYVCIGSAGLCEGGSPRPRQLL